MNRKPTKNTRGPNADEKRFHAWCKEQRCCVSGGAGVTEVHHCKGSTYRENKVLIGHFFVLPLSQEKHREYHAGTKRFIEKYGKQCDLWLENAKKYELETGNEIPYDVIKSIAMVNR